MDNAERLRRTARILIEEVGADGPTDAEDAARRAVARIKELHSALAVATIAMASVWPEDFRKTFTGEQLRALLAETKPDAESDFTVEGRMYEALFGTEARRGR